MTDIARPAPRPLPRRAWFAAAGGAALLLLVARWGARGPAADEPEAAIRVERKLRFIDRSDGGIDVVDADSARVIDSAHGEQGFLRGTLRGLARERRRRGLGDEVPLQLQLRANGRRSLIDPATGTRIDLEAFGPDNAAVFARWLGRPTPAKETP